SADAVVHVMVVSIDKVDVAGLVDADVDELVSVAYRRVRIDVYRIVGEAEATVDRDSDPDRMGAAAEAREFARISDAAEGLVDQVIGRINGKVSDLVLVCRMPWMVSIKCVRHLRVCRATVVAACYEEIVGCGVCMVGVAYLVGVVGRDTFPVVHWNGFSGVVDDVRGTSVLVGDDL